MTARSILKVSKPFLFSVPGGPLQISLFINKQMGEEREGKRKKKGKGNSRRVRFVKYPFHERVSAFVCSVLIDSPADMRESRRFKVRQ